MDEKLILRNRLKAARAEKHLSQGQLAEMVGVSRNTISSIETQGFYTKTRSRAAFSRNKFCSKRNVP